MRATSRPPLRGASLKRSERRPTYTIYALCGEADPIVSEEDPAFSRSRIIFSLLIELL